MNVSYEGTIEVICNQLLHDSKDTDATSINLLITPSQLESIFRRDGKEVIIVQDTSFEKYMITFKVTPTDNPYNNMVQVILTNTNSKQMYLVLSSRVFFDQVLNEYMKIVFSEKMNYMMEFDFIEPVVNEEALPDEFEEDLDE